jgi:hypothetical protein
VSTFQAATLARRGHSNGRPGYWKLLPGTLYGQVVGSIALWGACMVLALLAVAGISFSGDGIYLPWQIDGAWSLTAAIGWGTLVATLMGVWVRQGVANRTGVTPALGWCMLAAGIGGYGSMLIAQSAGIEVLLAVGLTPPLVSVLAFESSGEPRPFPFAQTLSGGGRIGILAALTLVLVAPYGLLHPFVANGSGAYSSSMGSTSGDSGVYSVHVGQPVRVSAGLQGGRLGVTVTSVRLLASSSELRLSDVVVTTGDPGSPLSKARGLPVVLHPRRLLWITYSAALTGCVGREGRVDRVRVYYRIWGLALSQTVPLQTPTALTCGSM